MLREWCCQGHIKGIWGCRCSQTRILWGLVLCIRWEIVLCGTTGCYIWQKCFSGNHTYWNYLLTYITTCVYVPLLIWRDVTKSVLKLPLNPNQLPVLMTSAGFGLGAFWPWHWAHTMDLVSATDLMRPWIWCGESFLMQCCFVLLGSVGVCIDVANWFL